MKQIIRSYRNQFFLCIASLPLGAAIGIICALFGTVLIRVTDFRSNHNLLLLPLLGVAGVLIAWCYSRFGKDSAKGISLFFEVYQNTRTDIPLRLVPMVMTSTWLTHLFGGSAGREGAAVQMGGTIGHYVGSKIKIPKGNKILMIAGMAAGFGGLFRTPIAAVFFSLELFCCGSIEYSALLPSLISAYVASFVSGLLGIEKFTHFLSCEIGLDFPVAMKLIALGVIFSLIGMLFSILLKKLKIVLPGIMKNTLVRTLVCGTIIGFLSIICFQGRYSGLGTNLISAGFCGDIMPWDFALKLLFTVFTLAAGYIGGEFTPLFSIGTSAGFILAAVFGLPVELCAALGFVGVFASATNTFFGPVFIGAEIFGPEYIPMFAIVCALAYICNGNISIYPLQKQRADRFGYELPESQRSSTSVKF
jgi:H+/Cl- antiporter ClcA